jgi:hypothetical protein
MENKYLTLFLITVLIFCGLTMRQCRENRDLIEDVKKLTGYKTTAMEYKAKNGDLIKYNRSLEVSIGSLEIERKELMAEVKNMRIKKPQVITNVVTEVRVDSLFIPFDQPVPCDSFKVTFDYNKEDWLFLRGEVTNDGVLVGELFIPDTLFIVVGEKKNGLFKRNEIVVAVKNKNPLIRVTDIENYIITPKRRFWQKPWFIGLVGLTGFIVGSRL